MSKRNYTDYTKEYATDIPIIQRDYVQGSDANAEKRDSFIKMILDNLAGRGSEDSANANLDFIYGTTYEDSSKDSGFMPIDGQQRLTTLALIGWLLAQKSEPGKYKLPELRYRTRHTTEQFCKCLSEYKLPDEYGNLREHLLAEPLWMAERWLSDPSVSAMLDLLSAVDTKLKSAEYKDCIEEMANNFFTHNPISFFLLDMNNPLDKEKDHSSNVKAENDGFKLSEDLYIKMNARGKLLTPFENWKAQFTGMLESRFRNVPYEYQEIQGQTISIPEYFSYAIEHEWTDLLWPGARDDWEKLSPEERKEHPYPRIDEYFMKLLDYFTEIFYWEGFVNEGSIKTTHDRLKKNFPGIELSEMFSGEKHQWIGRRRISVYRNQENVIKLFRMLDALVMLSKNEGVKGLDTFFNSILSHGEWDITSENISVSEEMNKDGNIRFSTNLVDLCLDSKFSDVWSIQLRMLLRGLLKFVIEYPAASEDQLRSYTRILWGWEQAQRQRLIKGMGVRFNIRVEDYPLFRDMTSALLKSGNADESLRLLSDAELKSLKLTGENKKREYREKGFGKELAILGNSPDLKGDFSNIYPALEKYNPEETGKSFSEKFNDFINLPNTQKVIDLVGLGFKGIKTYSYTDRYRFYGSLGHWDYVFSSSDIDFQTAFTKWMCNERPSVLPSQFSLAYYIIKYPQFISSRTGNNKRGFYLYSENTPFEMTAMTGRYSARPLSGYNKCPYANSVVEMLPQEIKEKLKISNWGYGTTHGRLYIGDERYSIECRQPGWLWRNENNSQKWMTAWASRFEITSEGWVDSESEFRFNGNILLDLPGKDRIETAIAFITALYDLI